MKSPITGKEMSLQKEERTLTFRKEDYTIVHHSYRCEDSGEQFTSTELDELNMNQLYNQYRDHHNIPFPNEIAEIRVHYGLPASKMSAVLGLGINSYRNYEAGEVPSKSNANLIQLVKDTSKFKELVELSEEFDKKTKLKLLKKLEKLIADEKADEYPSGFSIENYLFDSELPDEYSGYRKPDLAKLTEMVVYFSEQLNPWKTQMNKLLFYADFLAFKISGFSISGTRYRAINMGPVPNNYNSLFEYMANNDHIDINVYDFGGEEFATRKDRPFNSELFDKSEIEILNTVVKRFKKVGNRNVKAEELIRLSHDEEAWLKNEKDRKLISYRDAFSLKHM